MCARVAALPGEKRHKSSTDWSRRVDFAGNDDFDGLSWKNDDSRIEDALSVGSDGSTEAKMNRGNQLDVASC